MNIRPARRGPRRIGTGPASLAPVASLAFAALLSLPMPAAAGRYQPDPKWLEAVRAPRPFVPYRLGVVEFKKGLSDAWLEYLGDFRATLRGANYFQQTDAPRLRVEIEQGYQDGRSDEDGCKESPGMLALTYRFLDGEREVQRLRVTTRAPVDGDSNDWDAAMAGNLKFLLLELRKSQGDAQFVQTAGAMEARIHDGLGTGSSTGCMVGAVLARGFMAAAEGAVAVVGGLGEVAGAALEVAASPQFQSTVHAALAEQQRQRAQQQAFSNSLSAPSPAPQRAAGEPQRAAQPQSGGDTGRPRAAEVSAPARPLPAQGPAPAAKPALAAARAAPDNGPPTPALAAPQITAAPAAAKPLRFVLMISMRNLPGDKVNPSCYSNVITRPGPPGWGAPGFLPTGSGEQARQTVYGLKANFIAQCRAASGREITSEGNFNFQTNQSPDTERSLPDVRPRHREDVLVAM